MKSILKIGAYAGGGILGLFAFLIMLIIQLFIYGAMIVLSIYVFKGVMSHFHHSTTGSNSQTASAFSPYTSVQDKYKINFPGRPQITTTDPQTDSSGVTRTARTYWYENDDKSQQYNVVVIHYNTDLSGVDDNTLRSSLESDLNSIAREGNESISNSNYINFEGYTALQANLNSSDNEIPSHILFFLRNNDEFLISTGGVAQSKFDSFIESFQQI